MAVSGGQVERFKGGGPDPTITAAAAITEGRLVELTADFTGQHAGAGSTKVVGVAKQTAGAVGDKIAAASSGVWNLTASGAIAAGDVVIAAAAGKVATAGAAPDARTVVGIALEAIADTAVGAVMLRLS